jgi:hypothetical protein
MIRPEALTAHPGVLGAFEWRYGQYGAVQERGGDLYGQAPTVAMPVGFELAWGNDCFPSPFGLFFPLLDPLAFLNYDAGKDARLPGPSFLTVVSPGVGMRFGIPTTPLSLMPFFMFRPGFRQWEADAGGGGAHALQAGLLATVDVTLFEMVSR